MTWNSGVLPHEPLRLCEKNDKLTSSSSVIWPICTKLCSICGKDLTKVFTHVTPTGVPFWCFAIKPSTQYNFHMQFEQFGIDGKHVDSCPEYIVAAHPDMCGLCGPFIAACRYFDHELKSCARVRGWTRQTLKIQPAALPSQQTADTLRINRSDWLIWDKQNKSF